MSATEMSAHKERQRKGERERDFPNVCKSEMGLKYFKCIQIPDNESMAEMY